jgi:hypothetical protein
MWESFGANPGSYSELTNDTMYPGAVVEAPDPHGMVPLLLSNGRDNHTRDT